MSKVIKNIRDEALKVLGPERVAEIEAKHELEWAEQMRQIEESLKRDDSDRERLARAKSIINDAIVTLRTLGHDDVAAALAKRLLDV